MRRWIVITVLLLLGGPIMAGLTPGDIVVVYNGNTLEDEIPVDWTVSKRVADYYCAERGIPDANKVGVKWPYTGESTDPRTFYLRIQTPLEQFLHEHFHSDEVPIGEDPIKAIVLCYGIPTAISGEIVNAVDSKLTMLFNETPWGNGPLSFKFVANSPYWQQTQTCLQRDRPADFAEFRTDANNDRLLVHPGFFVIRMLDATHALAGGVGALFRGVQFDGIWEWTSIPMQDRGFTIWSITDICVSDPQHAYVSTEGGTVIQTSDGGQTWQTIRAAWGTWWGSMDHVKSLSYNGQIWIALVPDMYSTYPIPRVQKREGGSWISASGNNLPADIIPYGISAVDQSHVWVSGESATDGGGIWFTDDSGDNWQRQHASPAGKRIGDVAVRTVGGSYIGWAVQTDGAVLQTTDGANWSPVSGVMIPLYADSADLAVYDESHVAIVSYSGGFLVYDGSAWTVENTDSANSKQSAAWAGGDVLAGSVSDIRRGQGSPGSFTWDQPYTGTSAHVNMRYLVTRLDAFAEPLVEVPTGGSIPADIKNMIYRSVYSSDHPEVTNGARFVIDSGNKWTFYSTLTDCLEEMVGAQYVEVAPDGVFLTGELDVIGYTNNGSYDTGANAVTDFYRPFHSYREGAIGIISNVSNDGATVRSARHLAKVQPDSLENVEAGKVKITIPYAGRVPYTGLWVGVHDGNDTLLSDAADSQYSVVGNDLVITIDCADLTGIGWPADHKTYAAVRYPADDPQYPLQEVLISRTPLLEEIYTACQSGDGIAYIVYLQQSLAAELIHEGCCGTTANVTEPSSGNVYSEVILPEYAGGCSWAESAYMGLPNLGQRQIVLGDPLMSPYATPPAISFTEPEVGATVYGTLLIRVSAESEPEPETGIKRVEYWLTNENDVYRHAGIATESPFVTPFDTTSVQDGSYKLRAVAYENNAHGEAAECYRDITIANSSPPTTISITTPAADGQMLTGTVNLAAAASNPSAVSRVDFWLVSDEEDTLLGSSSSSPYSCSLDTTAHPDGPYSIYAIAELASGGTAGSPPRSVSIGNYFVASIREARKLADNSPVFIGPKPVVAGTTLSMSGAFYLEEEDRSAGLRVAWSGAADTGKLATVRGTIGSNPLTGERELTASSVWLIDGAPEIRPVFMINRTVGGEAPDDEPDDEPYTNAVTGTYGLYNTGTLITTMGKVVCTGPGYVYIDDGTGLYDGNSLQKPIKVRLDGSAILTEFGVPGLKVYFGDIAKPGIDDYVSITGISSLEKIGNNYVRYVRVRSREDVDCPDYYVEAAAFDGQECGGPTGIKLASSAPDVGDLLPVGKRVRLADKAFMQNDGLSFVGEDGSGGGPCQFTVNAQTAIQGDPYSVFFTVTGTIVDPLTVQADAVYKGGSGSGAGGGNMGLSSLGSNRVFSASSDTGTSSEEGPFEPWPGPTAEEVMASDWFNAVFYRPGSVGWVLAQPDGTVVTLIGELVLSGDGNLYGIKETCDPIPNAPRLYLQLGYQPKAEIIQAQIDIVNGAITTLQDGKRAIVKPEAVYVYTDTKGRPYAGIWLKSTTPETPWPWAKQVYP